jgi:hypothetical protein
MMGVEPKVSAWMCEPHQGGTSPNRFPVDERVLRGAEANGVRLPL